MSNARSPGIYPGKGKHRAEPGSPTKVDTEERERLSFEESDTERTERPHFRSASVPLLHIQLQHGMPGLVLSPIRRKPVLSVDSVNSEIQQHGEAVQRDTTLFNDPSQSPRPLSTSSGSGSPSRSPAFRSSTNTYQDRLQRSHDTAQAGTVPSPRRVRTVSPLTTIPSSDHGSLHSATSALDQTMDHEDATSRQSSTRRSPQRPVTPRKSA